MTLHEAARFLMAPERRHPSFPIVDGQGKVLGIIDPPLVIRLRRAGKHRNTRLADLLSSSRPQIAYPDEYLESVADRLTEANVAHLPVVSRTDQTLVGYLGWKDLMRAKMRLQEEEASRTTFPRPEVISKRTCSADRAQANRSVAVLRTVVPGHDGL
jgi:CBS domain-containing protein